MKRNANLLATFQYVKSLLGGEKQHKRTLVIALTIIELILIICAIISYNNKTLDKYIFGSSDLKNTNLFAIMIDDGNGGYKESTTDTFPGYEYFYNQEKSSCMDMAGKPIADSLLYNQDTKTALITVGDTSSCYLYFDNWKSGDSSEGENFAQYLINKGEMWQSGLDGDGYRYAGTNPNNYVCFGTSDVSECTTNQDKYMYRIIGVFNNSGNNSVKIIKSNYLDSKMKYSSASPKKIESTETIVSSFPIEIFSNLNNTYFLFNKSYDYMQNDKWVNIINSDLNTTCRTWKFVNQTQYTVIDLYNNKTAEEIFNHEKSYCSAGNYTVTLMNISDFILADGDDGLSYKTNNGVINNDSWITEGGESEWTNTYMGAILINQVNGIYAASAYGVGGSTKYINSNYEISVRPTMFLKKDVEFMNGDGTLNKPFIISNNIKEIIPINIDINISKNVLNISLTKGVGNLNKYCINNKASINDCEWKKISGSSITYEMSKSGKYYVHVIDDAGYIAEGSIVYTFANYLKDSGKMWQSGLEGDGYRFVGTGAYNTSSTPANFVCLGTGNKNTCVNNPDKLLYRIIGVFDDQVKLIKLSSLTENLSFAPGTMFVQTSDQYRSYSSSRLVSLLNSTTFLTNTDYFVSDDYRDMIDTNSKTTVTTSTYSSSGPNYYNSLTPSQIYLHENNRSSKTNTKGYWNTHNNKISVLDVSDYVLSLGDTAKSMTSGTYTNRNTLKTSWLFLGNNMYGSTSGNYTTENTTAVYGASSSSVYSTIYTWTINPSGYIYYTDKASEYATRPVFYLKKNIISRGGSGTLTDPYIIAN